MRALSLLLAIAGALSGHVASISPSCMLNGFPCPLPVGWAVDWALLNSTIMMPQELPDGFYPVHKWGLASLDWTVGANVWARHGAAQASCEETSVANCLALKRNGTIARCSIYHNLELSLEWLESQRVVMDDAHVAAGWFLKWKNGTVYNTPASAGGVTFRQYYIDWRHADAAAYYVSAIVASLVEGVDGTFTDDREGLPNEHPRVPADLGMNSSEVAALQFATQAAGQFLATSLAAVGKVCWDCLGGVHQQSPPSQSTCVADMRELCAAGMQGRSMFMLWRGAANQTLAAFLITHPPVAFLGDRMDDRSFSPLFALDVGVPLGLCQEVSEGVFSRAWTRGVAVLDCGRWQADLPFALLPGAGRV